MARYTGKPPPQIKEQRYGKSMLATRLQEDGIVSTTAFYPAQMGTSNTKESTRWKFSKTVACIGAH
jgi:hypothetical protein